MYLDYQPRNTFSGLPPIMDSACVTWVESMIRNGLNLVAISFEDGVIGMAFIATAVKSSKSKSKWTKMTVV